MAQSSTRYIPWCTTSVGTLEGIWGNVFAFFRWSISQILGIWLLSRLPWSTRRTKGTYISPAIFIDVNVASTRNWKTKESNLPSYPILTIDWYHLSNSYPLASFWPQHLTSTVQYIEKSESLWSFRPTCHLCISLWRQPSQTGTGDVSRRVEGLWIARRRRYSCWR